MAAKAAENKGSLKTAAAATVEAADSDGYTVAEEAATIPPKRRLSIAIICIREKRCERWMVAADAVKVADGRGRGPKQQPYCGFRTVG